MGKRRIALAATTLALVALPAAAHAENATVAAVSTNTVYTGSSGIDDVTVTLNNPPAWIFQRGGTVGAALMTAGNNCNDVYMDGTRIACGITGSVIFNLNGGNDRVLGGDSGHGMTFNGDAGDDFLSVSGAAGNIINGGADNDTILVSAATNANTIDGGPGNDTIEYPRGPDDVHGGPGVDTVLYSALAGTTISVSLDDDPHDGPPNGGQNIHSDVENVTGGDEDDTFSGAAGVDNALIGGNGNDTINAQDGGHDTVNCGNGDDTANVDAVDSVTGCEHVNLPDADHDGYTEDVDCNDHDASIHPGAVDTPGDGIDQDCSGGDAPLPILDADHDGSVPPADCNDHNAAIHPGATDIPENGVDENCDGHDAGYPVLDAPITNRWLFGSTTRVILLEVKGLPAGAKVKVTCKTKAKGCPFTSKTAAVRGGKAKLTSLFKHRKLKPGARIDVSVTAPAAIGKLVRFTIRRNKIPKAQTLCIRPGAKPAASC
jgi:Ca2+-binding RTX toxin-like protein